MVDNDTEIKCDKVCRDVTVTIQGCAFTLDLHVMALGGTNIVLGMAWLKLLGLVTTDYSHLTMSFKHNGEPITIHDNVDLGPFEIHHGQVRHLVNTHRIAALFHIQLQEHSPTPSGSPFTPPLLRPLLTKFSHLFQTSTQLPAPSSHHPGQQTTQSTLNPTQNQSMFVPTATLTTRNGRLNGRWKICSSGS